MNFKIIASLAAAATGALLLAGCDTVSYPMTYQIPIGYSQISSAYGVENLNVSATHDVDVQPGEPFFYQVISPVNLTLYVFDRTGPGPGGHLLSTMQGTTITSSVTPRYGSLEFVFSASQAYTAGTVQFTISDHPIAAPLMSTTTQSTTTTTTGVPAPVYPPGSSTTTTVTTPGAPPAPVIQQTTTTTTP